MWAAGILFLCAALLLYTANRAIPPDSAGLVERLGRIISPPRKDGRVWLIPFFERLLLFPTSPFSVECETRAELTGGVPVILAIQAECRIDDVLRFYRSVPTTAANSGNSAAQDVSRFLSGLLNSEGRALLRESNLDIGEADHAELASRLSSRIDWHMTSVGLRQSGLRVTRFDILPNAHRAEA